MMDDMIVYDAENSREIAVKKEPVLDMKTLEKRLKPREKRFCQLYINKWCRNATRAYMEAYGSAKGAPSTPESAAARASLTLKNINIKAYIGALEAQLAEELSISAPSMIASFQEISDDPKAAPADRLRAKENIAKILGLYNDNSNLSNNIAFVFNNIDNLSK